MSGAVDMTQSPNISRPYIGDIRIDHLPHAGLEVIDCCGQLIIRDYVLGRSCAIAKTDIGNRLARLYAKITGDSMHVFDWPDDYARSAKWIWDHPEGSFEEYVLFAESIGETNTYTREEFSTVWELRRLTAGTIDLE